MKLALLVQLFSWLSQFIGHGAAEGRAPALLDNLLQGEYGRVEWGVGTGEGAEIIGCRIIPSGCLGTVLLAFGVLVPRFQLSVTLPRCLLSPHVAILTFPLVWLFCR